jgi:hypothetical protein
MVSGQKVLHLKDVAAFQAVAYSMVLGGRGASFNKVGKPGAPYLVRIPISRCNGTVLPNSEKQDDHGQLLFHVGGIRWHTQAWLCFSAAILIWAQSAQSSLLGKANLDYLDLLG